MAALDPFVLWDLNPCNPTHKIYTDYIDKYKETYVGGYQYEHFTIKDNLSITPKRREEIESQYIKGTVWYRRDIEGERCIAEGLVYPMYENAIIDHLPVGNDGVLTATDYVISIDYGTMNAFAAMLWSKRGGIWYGERNYYYSGRNEGVQKTDEEYANDLDEWIADIWEEYQHMPVTGGIFATERGKIRTIIDPSAASFIALLRKREWCKVTKADNNVADGIRETAVALQLGLIKVLKSCKNWVSEASGYVWKKEKDNEKEIDESPVKVNDHDMDATRYFVKTMRITAKNRQYSLI